MLKSLLPKREYLSRSTRIDQLSLDAKTTSVIESQNSALKQGTLRVTPNFSITKSCYIFLEEDACGEAGCGSSVMDTKCPAKLSPIEWAVFPINSLRKSLGVYTTALSLIPKFRRLRKVSLVNNSFLCCD